jgi:hypothetical protein
VVSGEGTIVAHETDSPVSQSTVIPNKKSSQIRDIVRNKEPKMALLMKIWSKKEKLRETVS